MAKVLDIQHKKDDPMLEDNDNKADELEIQIWRAQRFEKTIKEL